MKNVFGIIGIVTVLAFVVAGCGQSESTGSSVEETVTEETVVEEVPVQQTVTQAVETAKQVLNEANNKVQEILTDAKALVSEQKYEEATNLLQKLSNFELTPEQQKMVDDLKATIQKAMQSEAVKQGTKAIGNMLGGEKN